jgi:hypothetical protein
MDWQYKWLWDVLESCWKRDPRNRIKAGDITLGLRINPLTKTTRALSSSMQTNAPLTIDPITGGSLSGSLFSGIRNGLSYIKEHYNGQSARLAANERFECPVCLGDWSIQNIVEFEPYKHRSCRDCTRLWIAVELDSNHWPIVCLLCKMKSGKDAIGIKAYGSKF